MGSEIPALSWEGGWSKWVEMQVRNKELKGEDRVEFLFDSIFFPMKYETRSSDENRGMREMCQRFEERRWEVVVSDSGKRTFQELQSDCLAVLSDRQYEVGPVIMIV